MATINHVADITNSDDFAYDDFDAWHALTKLDAPTPTIGDLGSISNFTVVSVIVAQANRVINMYGVSGCGTDFSVWINRYVLRNLGHLSSVTDPDNNTRIDSAHIAMAADFWRPIVARVGRRVNI